MLRHIRRESDDALFWSATLQVPNFGDLLGPFFFRRITGTEPVFRKPSNSALRTVFLTVGSVMHWCRDDCIVWGSGILKRDMEFPRPHRVCSVRGPLTQARFYELGYDCPEIYGDPGLLLPRFISSSEAAGGRIGVVPHFVDHERCRQLFEEKDSLRTIDVLQPIEAVVAQITQCDAVLSSSLHGLIVAHAYGIPAAWIEFTDDLWGDGTKFSDHYASLGFDRIPDPVRINRKWATDELFGLIRDWPQPGETKVQKVCDAVLESCPFPRPKVS